MLNPKIADHHLMRKACIYIRQSTMAQVRFNQESTERQYNLADQAKSLGWMPEQIRIRRGSPRAKNARGIASLFNALRDLVPEVGHCKRCVNV